MCDGTQMCDGDDALIADLGVREIWVPQAEALSDVRVTDMHGYLFYFSHSVAAVLTSAEEENKHKYLAAAEL